GYNGPTTVRVAGGRITLGDPARAPFDLKLVILNLELDKRLKDRTPPEFAELWDVYSPGGRISAAVNLVREREGGRVGFAWKVNCLDVSMLFRDFKYPVDHIRGEITFEKKQIRFNVQTLVGNKPLTATGTIDNPGPYGHVNIDFEGESLPVDKTLLNAIPPDIRKVVQEFNPTGTVGGRAHVERTRTLPTEPPAGKVAIDAYLDLKGDCTMKWVKMPYPVSNLTGQLELHPDRWEFKNIHGTNGQAELTGSGSVNKLPTPPGPRPDKGKGDPLLVDLHLNAKNLPFNDQLYRSLPFAWRKSWETLNPVGASDVDARIHIEPGKPDRYHMVVNPRPETLVDLKFTRPPKLPVDPGGTFGLRMEKVKGEFTYDDGLVVMREVGFRFNGSPVQFDNGKVKVEPDGRFALRVAQFQALDLRLDAELRKMMPPIMAQFAQKIDEGHPIRRVEGNLGLSWAGPGNLVQCDWDHALVVFIDNSILAGVPLEHIQGQLDNVRGKFDGKAIEVHGILKLDSINLVGQQVTSLETPFHVERGKAQLSNVRGKLLGGTIEGQFDLTLDATPSYSSNLSVVGADLQRYAKTLPGKQTFRGLVFAKLELSGMGSDLHSLQGKGEAHVKEGDLGELPVLLRLVKRLNNSAATKTMFDSADVYITIRGGESVLDPIKLTGNAFSLQGEGTMGIQGDLDLRFKPLYGRDRVHVPYLSEMSREASGQLLVIRAQGPIAYPRFSLEPLPYTSDALKGIFRSIGSRRSSRPDSTQ
ncbi:AsmA family protein, partial [Singulisphaera rosea]